MARRFDGRVELIQTDGGSEFKEVFADRVLTYCQRHRIARPYKKNEQAYIESFNRTVRKECLGWLNYAGRTSSSASRTQRSSSTDTTTIGLT